MIAGVFPGQGSQSIGMSSGWNGYQPLAQAVYREASDVLDLDLWALVANGDAAELDRTEITQPAMLAADVAAWRIYLAAGGHKPIALAGHSLGEYAALVAAESIDFADAVALVFERGRLMQAAVAPGAGAMAALLGLTDEAVLSVCAEAAQGQVCEAVNFNSPGQVVITGDAAAVARAEELAKAAGAKRFVPLPVSVPSHSSLMIDASRELDAYLAKVMIKPPVLPVLHNVDAQTHDDAVAIRHALVEQLYRPVQWVACVQALHGRGCNRQFEFGPGKVLTGLAKRIEKGVTGKAVFDEATLAAVIS
ncbi:ACP S-malonyltransferase [Halothiobacillus sp.]|uniref:ACP S-malonyltransferase n=1 Tax=Halothiobacillus sp. TaxID=1891311 RepID=UPI00261F014A|nr:ACP S-malonyltransferase [Halothiobacillus sp.]